MFLTVVVLVLVCLLTMAAIAFPIWAMVDVVGHPEEEWRAIGRNHTAWVLVLLVGTFAFLLVGVVAAFVYVLRVRPALLEAAAGAAGVE